MLYKPDWEQAKVRLEAFWHKELVDRCCVAVFAPRKTSTLPPFPELQWGPWLGGLDAIPDEDEDAIRAWWTDPEQNLNRATLWFENTYFGGEAIPATYVNWGAMAMAAMYGAPAKFNKTSVWYPAVIEDWDTWEWKFDPETNPTWQTILKIERCLVENSQGRYFVGKPELGNAADLLSLMRGMDKLAMDLIDHPEAVRRGIDVLSNTWVQLMEQAYQMTKPVNDGGDVLAWMSLWAPGRHDQIACDFSTVISPSMFRKLFVPDIVRMGNWCEYGTYHLDGPGAMKNMLDTILTIEQVDNIEWTPGAGSPPTYSPQYIPSYQKIQKSGRSLYLLAEPNEIELLLAELSPKGLFICTHADTQDEADDLLKKITKWSASKNVFPT